MKFSNTAARKRAMALRNRGTYVEGRFFGADAHFAAAYARVLAMDYGRDVQVVERITPVGVGMFADGDAFVLATCTADGSVFT
jgi:hypothetical protein